MKIGTKSLLFGVHQFLWHPWTVLQAWRILYPQSRVGVPLLISIFCHDLGYFGCPNMDGPEGKLHPEVGAKLARWLVQRWLWFAYPDLGRLDVELNGLIVLQFTQYHSSHLAAMHGRHPSPLYLADKASILCDPPWFYKLRARLSGEWKEYVDNSPKKGLGIDAWHGWYYARVFDRVMDFFQSR